MLKKPAPLPATEPGPAQPLIEQESLMEETRRVEPQHVEAHEAEEEVITPSSDKGEKLSLEPRSSFPFYLFDNSDFRSLMQVYLRRLMKTWPDPKVRRRRLTKRR